MEEAFRAFLLQQSALQSAVGDQIDWGLRPSGAAGAAVSLTLVSAPRAYTFEGRHKYLPARVQIDCWGPTYAAVKRAARAIINALDAIGTAADFDGAFVLNERDSSDTDQAKTVVMRTMIDARILFNPKETDQ